VPRRLASADPATTEYYVVIVENSGLSRSDGALRFMQAHMGPMILKRRDGCACARVVITDLDHNVERRAGIDDRDYRMPIDAVYLEFVCDKIVSISDDNAIRIRIEGYDVARPGRAAG